MTLEGGWLGSGTGRLLGRYLLSWRYSFPSPEGSDVKKKGNLHTDDPRTGVVRIFSTGTNDDSPWQLDHRMATRHSWRSWMSNSNFFANFTMMFE